MPLPFQIPKPRRAFVLGAIALFAACGVLVWHPWRSDDGLTRHERSEIVAVIRKASTEQILSIQRRPDGTVLVQTGVVRGPLDGSGHFYELANEAGHWRVISTSVWLA